MNFDDLEKDIPKLVEDAFAIGYKTGKYAVDENKWYFNRKKVEAGIKQAIEQLYYSNNAGSVAKTIEILKGLIQ